MFVITIYRTRCGQFLQLISVAESSSSFFAPWIRHNWNVHGFYSLLPNVDTERITSSRGFWLILMNKIFFGWENSCWLSEMFFFFPLTFNCLSTMNENPVTSIVLGQQQKVSEADVSKPRHIKQKLSEWLDSYNDKWEYVFLLSLLTWPIHHHRPELILVVIRICSGEVPTNGCNTIAQ